MVIIIFVCFCLLIFLYSYTSTGTNQWRTAITLGNNIKLWRNVDCCWLWWEMDAFHNSTAAAATATATVVNAATEKDPAESRPITLPIPISASSSSSGLTSTMKVAPVGLRQALPPGPGSHSPSSSNSVSSSTPSADGSSSQSEYFSYEPDERTGSLKATPRGDTNVTANATTLPTDNTEWRPSLGTDYQLLQSLKVGERFDEHVTVFEGVLSKKRRRRGTGFQKVTFSHCHFPLGFLRMVFWRFGGFFCRDFVDWIKGIYCMPRIALRWADFFKKIPLFMRCVSHSMMSMYNDRWIDWLIDWLRWFGVRLFLRFFGISVQYVGSLLRDISSFTMQQYGKRGANFACQTRIKWLQYWNEIMISRLIAWLIDWCEVDFVFAF